MDKYQALVEELLSLSPDEFSSEVCYRWSSQYNTDKGCLFNYCGNEDGLSRTKDDMNWCGCLTQVKAELDPAYTPELTEMIRNNPLIPDQPEKIPQDRTVLEEFARLQRYMDKTIRSQE